MTKTKVILWAIILGFIGYVIYLNQTFLFEKHAISVKIFGEYSTKEIYTVLWFLICFVIGFIVSYLFGMSSKHKLKKKIKKLKAEIDAGGSETQVAQSDDTPAGDETTEAPASAEVIEVSPDSVTDMADTGDGREEAVKVQ